MQGKRIFFSKSYRTLLKRLHLACSEKPHFVQDLRVLLSHGIVSRGTIFPPVYLSNARPGKECLLIDIKSLFETSKTDLRRAIERNLEDFPGKRVPLALAQVLYLKELQWIEGWLNKILSRSTSDTLKRLIRIGDGLDGDDFIPDVFFDGKDGKQFISSQTMFSVDGADVVYSAGAIGNQRELVVLTRREKDFPLIHSFLGPTVIGETAYSERYTEEKHFSRFFDDIPRTLSHCSLAVLPHVSLRAEIVPFDSEYKDKSEAGFGKFGVSHRQFYVHLTLTPTDLKVVEIVNVHFFRLDVENKELIEDIGYLDSAAVLQMIRSKIKEKVIGSGSSTAGEEGQEQHPASGPREFKVMFKSDTDGPVLLKGILYFKCAESGSVLHERSIEAIPFDPILYQY